MDPQTWELIFQGANTIGVVSICLLVVVLFIRGDIISKVVMDRVLSLYEKQMSVARGLLSDKLGESVAKQMTAFHDKLDEAMRKAEDRQRARDDEFYHALRSNSRSNQSPT